ncbi:hypothetical protein A6M14_00040 [Acinetobacter sp. Ac_877]|uniref:hypothetical protein n=1 Tax=Acinetobacter portensis TaxID=1839785 RepID=UPI00128B406A|nr:hypothetical protein [Acinetobacter portensis]MPW41051.1 hypothetical protein [Acinetobacter portensis]
MRYQIIDVYQTEDLKRYIAKCLKKHSPQFIVIESQRTFCLNIDIINVNCQHTSATSATGEEISLKILNKFDTFDKTYMSRL